MPDNPLPEADKTPLKSKEREVADSVRAPYSPRRENRKIRNFATTRFRALFERYFAHRLQSTSIGLVKLVILSFSFRPPLR